MIAYKFTGSGARSPFTGFVWPADEWVAAEGPLELCGNGIHACRAEALPRWVDEELWVIELEGVHAHYEGVLVAQRGRLRERIAAWDQAASRELARACARRALELANANLDPLIRKMAEDIVAIADGPDPSATALSMYCTAHAFDVAFAGGYEAERGRQAAWIRDRLGLDG